MPFVVGRGAWPSALSRARGFRVCGFAFIGAKRRPLIRRSGRLGAGFQRLRRISDATAIIVLTGYGSIATALSAVRLGADDFLTKPADADQLMAAYEKMESDTISSQQIAPEPSIPTLGRVQWEHIQRVLGDCNGNISQAARLLGVHRRSLQRKLSKYPPRG